MRVGRSIVTAVAVLGLLGAGCGGPTAGTADGVEALARDDGWREGSDAEPRFVVVEIAWDRATAQQAWEENVDASLPDADGTPDAPGRYGSLEQVDLDEQALVVVSSGTSSSCPAWVADLRTDEDRLLVELDRAPAQACTDDFVPYRMVLAVDRDRLPGPDGPTVTQVDVPSDNLVDVDAAVGAYPLG